MGWLIRSDEDRIRGFLSRAGVVEREASPTGVLSTESVLVFWGEWQQTLRLYDRNGRQIGEARRIRDRYSKVGYRYHYGLWDTELRCVVRDVMRPRFGDYRRMRFRSWAATKPKSGGSLGPGATTTVM
jgi:hypothetical protein